SLYEVGSGRILWRSSRFETVVNHHLENGFRVIEQWEELWKDWLPNLKYATNAHRSMEDGRLLFRSPNTFAFDPLNINKSQSLVVLPDGAVHRLPLERNWPLIF